MATTMDGTYMVRGKRYWVTGGRVHDRGVFLRARRIARYRWLRRLEAAASAALWRVDPDFAKVVEL